MLFPPGAALPSLSSISSARPLLLRTPMAWARVGAFAGVALLTMATTSAQRAVSASYTMPRAFPATPKPDLDALAIDSGLEGESWNLFDSLLGTLEADADPIAVDSGSEGESWKLFGSMLDGTGIEAGGWLQLGYHSESNDLFNTDPDRINLQQAWLFAEKLAKSEDGEIGFGFRFDGLFGTDGGDTVAFGNGLGSDGNPQGWDAGPNFQRGSGYGWALPQAYLEVASGDWTVKAGHFYTLIGYEVVGAPGNFFYSHAITMYNSEPFTHSGVLASYAASDDTTYYGGWTAGWDTGFDQFGEGSNFLGGVSTSLSDDVALAYMTTLGDFGARGSDGFMQSVVVDVALSDDWNYVAQSDLLHVGSTGEDTIGLNQYLFYQAKEDLDLGARFEWWKNDAITGYAPHGGTAPASGSVSHFSLTAGANYLISPNIMLRPEYRYDWSEGADYNQGTFGIDLVATF